MYLGPVVEQGPYNRKGSRELKILNQLHERVLGANGGSWSNPPTRQQWPARAATERLDILRLFRNQSVWGIKDPRLLLLLDSWLEALDGHSIALAATVRHPMAVANSLAKRNNLDLEHGLRLWFAYNSKLLAARSLAPLSIVDFDCNKMSYEDQCFRLLDELAIEHPVRSATFYDKELVNQSAYSAPLPEALQALYAELKSLSLSTVK